MPADPTTEPQRELIQNLCLEAGRMMEDLSAEMARTLPASTQLVCAHIAQLQQVAADIVVLANAASVLATALVKS